MTEQPKKRGNPNFTSGNQFAKKQNPLTERIAFRLLPEDYNAFIQAAGGKEHLKGFVLSACHEAVYRKRTRGY